MSDYITFEIPCLCGCGEMPTLARSWYLPGHDSKHISKAGKAIVNEDAVTRWVSEMPSPWQKNRLDRYLSKRGIDLDALIEDERRDCA